MEHIKKHLERAQAQTNSLTVSKPDTVLTDEEATIIEFKYLSKRFSHMTDAAIQANAEILLLKIHVITGWTIPEKEFMNILVDQFTKAIKEKYLDLNTDEIEYAFRKSGTVIEDWGKSMNLNLMDKVLLPYLNDRYRISEVERQISYKKTEKPFSLENIDYRRMINEDYLNFLTGWKYEQFPVHYYKQLVRDGYIIEDVKELTDQQKDGLVLKVFEQAKESGIINLYEK